MRSAESIRYHCQDQITDACFNCGLLPNELKKFEKFRTFENSEDARFDELKGFQGFVDNVGAMFRKIE